MTHPESDAALVGRLLRCASALGWRIARHRMGCGREQFSWRAPDGRHEVCLPASGARAALEKAARWFEANGLVPAEPERSGPTWRAFYYSFTTS